MTDSHHYFPATLEGVTGASGVENSNHLATTDSYCYHWVTLEGVAGASGVVSGSSDVLVMKM